MFNNNLLNNLLNNRKLERVRHKDKPLTIRERRLIKFLAEGMSMYKAMIKAGYSESTARVQAKRTIGRSRIQKAINELMEKEGLTDEKLLDCLIEGLEAKKIISPTKTYPRGKRSRSEF
jgi:phage terminase small subunit